MVPSGIKRTTAAPFKTRRLENGTIVVEDAYDGQYDYSSKVEGPRIKGLSVDEPRSPATLKR